MEIQQLGETEMSQGNLPLGAAVNISALTLFQAVVVAVLLQWGASSIFWWWLVSHSQALSVESSLLSQRFCVLCKDHADPFKADSFWGCKGGVSIAINSLPVRPRVLTLKSAAGFCVCV